MPKTPHIEASQTGKVSPFLLIDQNHVRLNLCRQNNCLCLSGIKIVSERDCELDIYHWLDPQPASSACLIESTAAVSGTRFNSFRTAAGIKTSLNCD
jgi:hypothetical protein